MDIKKILIDYVKFIEEFEKIMMLKYNLSVNPYTKAGKLFERNGNIDSYKYHYHGAGCTIEKDGVICEYNIAPLNVDGIKFSLWALSEFIGSNPKYKNLNYTIEAIEDDLKTLLENGTLRWDEIDGHFIKIYIYDKYKLRIIE